MAAHYKITDLKPHKKNPRKISTKEMGKLKNSIENFQKMMAIKPIIVDEKFFILSGNMRYKALQQLGYETIPKPWVKVVKDLTAKEKKEFMLKDNHHSGDWALASLSDDSFWNKTNFSEWLGFDVFEKKQIKGNFKDTGKTPKNQYAVIVICKGEADQKETFKFLTDRKYKCKISVV